MSKKLLKKIVALAAAVPFAISVFVMAGNGAVVVDAKGLTQSTDPGKVEYGTPTAEEEKILTAMFDYDYYLAQNPELVEKLGASDYKTMLNHFLHYGVYEGRTCNANFDPAAYAAAYSDAKKECGKNIVKYYTHYSTVGVAGSRNITTLAECARNNITVQSLVDDSVQITPEVYDLAERMGITDYQAATETQKLIQEARTSGGNVVVTVNRDNDSDTVIVPIYNDNSGTPAAPSTVNPPAPATDTTPAPAPAADTTTSPTADSTPVPAVDPTPAPALEPTPSPNPTPIPEPSVEPTPAADPEPAATDPEPAPAADPEPAPAADPEPAPAADPEPAPAADPEQAPTTDPESTPSTDPAPSTDPEPAASLQGYTQVGTVSANGGVLDIKVYKGTTSGYGAWNINKYSEANVTPVLYAKTADYDYEEASYKQNEEFPEYGEWDTSGLGSCIVNIPVCVNEIPNDGGCIITTNAETKADYNVQPTTRDLHDTATVGTATLDSDGFEYEVTGIIDSEGTSETEYEVGIQLSEDSEGSDDLTIGIAIEGDDGLTVEDSYEFDTSEMGDMLSFDF